MQLKRLVLRNIRSYKSGTIEFPVGITVLAGDIGAGKSTALLAVEFALFGIMKGDISGSNLLRHGEKEGSVELYFEVDGKEILIARSLKRGSAGIGQDTGYIVIDGTKTSGTAVEIKSKVLLLLGYPKDMLSKSKNLIYRYTVYTPQEDMKLILYENRKDRLDILRRVFGIDRYQRVLENSQIIIKELRERRIESAGFSRDIESKISLLNKIEEELRTSAEEEKKLEAPLREVKEALKKKALEIDEFESRIRTIQEEGRKLARLDAELSMNIRRRGELNTELLDIEKRIEKVERPSIDIDSLHRRIAEIEILMPELEKEMKKANEELGAHRMKLREASDLKGKIVHLKDCPFCRQEITDEHKGRIIRSQEELESAFNAAEGKVRDSLKDLEKRKSALKSELAELEMKEKAHSIAEMKIKAQEELERRRAQLKGQMTLITDAITELTSRKAEMAVKVSSMKELEAHYSRLRKEKDSLLAREKEISMSVARRESGIISLKRQISSLKEEISAKDESRKKALLMERHEAFISGPFKDLILRIEKAVMRKAHTEFNELFIRWFDMLIADESINVRLDDEFSPVIVQDGYETELSSLSGGEKTSAALAYRLALNKVINDILGTVRTKDIIILDEPTDGFSSEQLDRMRDVLSILGMKQVIMVSHESKMESYADTVIRIEKENQISTIR